MTVNPAPITSPVIDDKGRPTLPWTLFFNQNYEGDPGTDWTPVFTGLTGSTTSVEGRYYRLSQYLIYFSIDIVPNGATSATAGSTYITGLPINFTNNGFNTVLSGATGGAIGMNRESDNRIYVPAWTSVSVPLTVIGLVEAT